MRLLPHLLFSLFSAILATPAVAQGGDKKSEPQPGLPADLEIPPAPVLSPEDALASFTLQPGFRIEIAAAEPLVHDPVCVAFDAAARMWVVEMRGFMPDVDGNGEREPNGNIVVLDDTDGDGRMDRRTVFLAGLVLPRGVLPIAGGALVIAPPELLFCRDTDGDGRSDARETVLAKGFEAGLHNPEHAGNGMMVGLDNWVYFASFGKRIRRVGGEWKVEPAYKGGQWGLTQDDVGRRFYNTNSSYLFADHYPTHWAVRNDAHRPWGVGHPLDRDQSTWPGRITPGINRGYQKGMLRDFRLARFTATCGPCIYRGGLFGDDVRGNAFVPEPAGNFVRRAIVAEKDGRLFARNAYEKVEWLTSADERFRPVNCHVGPDGALYVVDMYRGIIQHKDFVTTFLRRQIVARGLAEPLGLGRIYRVLPAGSTRPRPRRVAGRPDVALVAMLGHANGWVRDTAQRLLIEKGAGSAGTANGHAEIRGRISDLLSGGDGALARLHAFWTLAGRDELTSRDLARARRDDDPWVRAAACRRSDPEALAELTRDPSPVVRLHAVLGLGDHPGAAADAALSAALRAAGDGMLRSAALSGLGGRELEFLVRLVGDEGWSQDDDGARAVLRDLARLVVKRRDVERIARLLHHVAAAPHAWQRDAMLDGMTRGLPGGKARRYAFRFTRKPTGLTKLERTGGHDDVLAGLRGALWWPALGQPKSVAKPLTKAQKRLLLLGKHYYKAHCTQCHQEKGQGQQGVAPSLVDSEIVLGPPGRQIRIVLHGITGPIEIEGTINELTMEPLGEKLTDRQIAAILTYTRRSWGHEAEAVGVEDVTRVREATKGRQKPWTREELRWLR